MIGFFYMSVRLLYVDYDHASLFAFSYVLYTNREKRRNWT